MPGNSNEIVTYMEVESNVLDEYLESNMFEIYISEQAFERMVKHCEEHAPANLEVMGFLLGDKYIWKDKLYIVIQEAVTTDVDSSSVYVRFSEEGMGKLFGVLDDIKYDYLLVGWYHSHPGHTCFFSETDVTTQNAMFKKEYQIGIVIDPINRDAKAFTTKGTDFYQKSFSVIPYADAEKPWHELLETIKSETIHPEEPMDVYLTDTAMEKMVRHCGEYAPQNLEVMGFLIGDKYTWEEETYVTVLDVVTTDLDSTSVHVKFSEEGFGKLFEALDEIQYEYVLVGWYHSHPGHTCFLSSTDINTQETMFKQPYHVAIVVDPINIEIGAFTVRDHNQVDLNLGVFEYGTPQIPWHEISHHVVKPPTEAERVLEPEPELPGVPTEPELYEEAAEPMELAEEPTTPTVGVETTMPELSPALYYSSFALPFVLGIFGGVAGWWTVKNYNKRSSTIILVLGIAFGLLWLLMAYNGLFG